MFYALLQRLVRIIYRVYFRRIYFHNGESVPADKPVLLACNHPGAAVEPVLVGLYTPHHIYYITRGDIANNPKLLWFFEATNQIPIYRFRDGFSNLKKNAESFAYVFRKLAARKTIIIFAEGLCVQEKKLRPLQKGLGKMAFGAYDEMQVRDTLIIPVCVNFSEINRFRSDVQAAFGKPIPIADYLETYDRDPAQALRQVTADTQAAMRELIIHIDHKKDEKIVDTLLEIAGHDAGDLQGAGLYKTNTRLKREIGIANAFNALEEDERQQVRASVKDYQGLLEQHNIGDGTVKDRGALTLWSILPLLVLSPLALWAWISNQPAFRLSRRMAETLPKTIEFYPSIRIFSLIIFNILQWAILSLVLGLWLGWPGFWIATSIPVLGYWLPRYWELLLENLQALRYRQLSQADRSALAQAREALRSHAGVAQRA